MLQKLKTQIGAKVESIQQKAARALSRWFEKRPRRCKKLLLFLFCIAFSCGSIAALVSAFQHKRPPQFTIGAIRLPPHATGNGYPPAPPNDIPPFVRKEVSAFRHYVDSLRKDSMGRSVFDSLVRVRPGLLDSLAQLERILQTTK